MNGKVVRRLFLFRPEPGCSRSAESARAMGLDAACLPLFAIEPVEWDLPDPAGFDALVITSANAVRAAGSRLETLRQIPAHCVGEASARAAESAGLSVATIGTGGIDELLGAIDPAERLLHLAGEDRRMPDEPRLQIQTVTVYRARALPRPKQIGALAGHVAAVHSPRSAARLAELVEPARRARVRLAAISAAAADCAGVGWERVATAAAPNEPALLALAARLCER